MDFEFCIITETCNKNFFSYLRLWKILDEICQVNNIRFDTKPILGCSSFQILIFLLNLPLFPFVLDEILMPWVSPPNYAKFFLLNYARYFCCFFWLCIIHCAVLGNVVRQCASSLLGSYIHQEYCK